MANGTAGTETPWWQHVPVPNFQQVGNDTETLLDIVSRIASAFLVVLIIGLCVAWAWFRRKFHKQPDARGHKSSWTRRHKIREGFYNYCCCGYCCHDFYRRNGFDALQVGRTLRVTLLQAVKIQKQIDIYFEVWTEPSEGYPKNSRVHTRAVGSCSLGGEQLELDWYGDEEEVVLQAVHYSAKQGGDVPLAELRIPRAAVEKYAKEASGRRAQSPDSKRGARLFTFRGLTKQEKSLRLQRFGKAKGINAADAVPLLPASITNSLEEHGMAIVTLAEKEILDRDLKDATKTRASSLARKSKGDAEEDHDKVFMEVALKCEFVQPEQFPVGPTTFRSSSFQS
ncbi:unnamed protein product [Prorocentrum cordatum]|uniref:Uncharacterized protein n=1 Tax=Prorocentrum cordatum TaxID=2364126 RepID=A0ABN9Q5K4_9DINO|nr:unnamed protein product [Polarella glacialis]